jgi:hypothetical protein
VPSSRESKKKRSTPGPTRVGWRSQWRLCGGTPGSSCSTRAARALLVRYKIVRRL